MPQFTPTRRGKNLFAVPHSLRIQVYDFTELADLVHAAHKDHADRASPRFGRFGRHIWDAIDNPGKVHVQYWEEPNYEYGCFRLFNPTTLHLATNMWFTSVHPTTVEDRDLVAQLRDYVLEHNSKIPAKQKSQRRPV
jgi:hypothetical protein